MKFAMNLRSSIGSVITIYINTILLHFEGLENSINELKATFGSLMKEGSLKLTSLSH